MIAIKGMHKIMQRGRFLNRQPVRKLPCFEHPQLVTGFSSSGADAIPTFSSCAATDGANGVDSLDFR